MWRRCLNAAGTLRFWGWLRVYRHAEGELFPGLTIAVLIVAGLIFRAKDEQRAETQKPSKLRIGWRVDGDGACSC